MALRALYQSKRGNMTAEQTTNVDVVRSVIRSLPVRMKYNNIIVNTQSFTQ